MSNTHPFEGCRSDVQGLDLARTPAVSINPAFFQEIKEDHQYLQDLFDELHDLCSTDSTADLEPVFFHQLIAALRDQIALHFSLEEHLGYFDNPVEINAGLYTVADNLRAQHTELFAEIADLADQAADLLYPWIETPSLSEVVKQFLHFREKYLRHEKREWELIWTAQQIDIGGES